MRAEVNIADALRLIEHRTITDRNEGFANLKNILAKSRALSLLKDGSVHRIYETLFQVAIDDRATYLKASTSTTRTAAENRLSACASALRNAAKETVRLVRVKTLRALLDHITQLFDRPNGMPCEPLALDYAKCLTTLLSYQPHVEHLKREEREVLISFCIQHIESLQTIVTDEDTEAVAQRPSTASISNGYSYRSSRSRHNYSNSSQSTQTLTRQIADEMISCLAMLTAASNAGNGTQHDAVLQGVFGFLQNGSSNLKSQQEAFKIINNSLSWTMTQDVALTRKLLSQLVRLVRLYWPPKAAADALRDEMLITIVSLRPFLVSAMLPRENITLRSELASLLDVLRTEYGSRQQRNQLQMEDLVLRLSDTARTATSPIRTVLCSLRCASSNAESSWMSVYMMASLCKLLNPTTTTDGSSSSNEDDGVASRPRKRQRLITDFDELLDASTGGKTVSRISALQIIAFLSQQQAYSRRQLDHIVDKLSTSCADDKVDISSWAFFALASVALQAKSKHEALSGRWSSIWQLVLRAMSNATSCRPACHLIYIMIRSRLVPVQSLADLVQAITFSMDLNGPPIIADSVSQLLKYMVEVSQQMNPTNSISTAESLISWCCRTFMPSRFADGQLAVHQTTFEPADIVDLLSHSMGSPLAERHEPVAQYAVWNRVGQAWHRFESQAAPIKYLLLLPSTILHESRVLKPEAASTGSTLQGSPSCEAMLLNHLTSEAQRTLENWKQTSAKDMTNDTFSMFCKSCHVMTSLAFCASFSDARRRDILRKQVQDLLDSLASSVKSSAVPQDKVDAILTTFSTACTSLQVHNAHHDPCECELKLSNCIFDAMEGRTDVVESSGQGDEIDFMDMDGDFESQISRRTDHACEVQELSNDYAVAFGKLALRANVMIHAAVRAYQSGQQVPAGSDVSTATQVLNEVLALPDSLVFAGRDVISRLPQMGIESTAEDAGRLADFCFDHLERYEFERSEVALGTILDIMASMTAIWTNPANAQLYDDGLNMYGWYIKTGFSHGVLSPNVQCRLASLLLQLCHVDLDYGKDDDCPSARTSIFELINKGSIEVQYYIAERISAIFGLFVLSNHSLMFEDLRETLPKDTRHVEGIAIRLMFFSRLASAWHSLLRECVFYIVETAGQSKPAARFATHCIGELAKDLKFDSPQKLFRLFAPQLLYSWLEAQSVTSLPFSIFQYNTLEALISHNLSEITAQLVVRGSEDGLDAVISTLKTGKVELLKKCLAKTEAYCISYDISRSSNDTETSLRHALNGRDQLNQLLIAQYPAIVAQFFLSAQSDVDDRWLEKRNGYNQEANALKEMKSFSSSDKALPACQQPSFKSKWLCDQIERVCRRVGKVDPSQRWDPSAFSYVARALLNSIDSALGPLHTCLVVRRLRLLVCLGGDVAVKDYQAEMLIGALRPYLNDSQCADDAMGILQYLLHRGQPYLSTQMPFVRGTIMLMLLQIRKHARTRQESTTQESQHSATIGKMRKFHRWLVDYLRSCPPKEDSSGRSHMTLIQSLAHAQLPGNALQSTPESSLLLLLIENGHGIEDFFRIEHRDEALLLLSEQFEIPISIEEDCLKDDADSVRLSNQLWCVSRIPRLGKGLLSWVTSALARAYAATGQRPSPPDQDTNQTVSAAYEGIAKSQAAIAKRLVEALYAGDGPEASTADSTLRDVLLSFDDANDLLVFEELLPAPLVPALLQADYGYAPVLNPMPLITETDSIRHLREPTQSTLLKWVQQYSIALCLSAKGTPVLPALVTALRTQPSLSLDLFPMIVHILLAAELERNLLLRTELSHCLTAHLNASDSNLLPKQTYLLKLLLYLRAQTLPGEHTQADRLLWLDVDWLTAAAAAERCAMPETALLFAESATTPSTGNRRSSGRASMSLVTLKQVPQDLLLSIFKSVDEPDSFYGVEQPASLDSVLERFDFEKDGFSSLMFRSAQTDSHALQSSNVTLASSTNMVRSLSMLNLNSLTFALLSAGGAKTHGSSNELLNVARKLQQWDITVPELASGPAANCFSAFQELSRATSQGAMRRKLESLLLEHMEQTDSVAIPSREWFGALASLAEVQELVGSSSQAAIRASWERLQSRQEWMHLARFEDINLILTNRRVLFSTLVRNDSLLREMRGNVKSSRAIEVEALLSVADFAREHGSVQEALTAVRQAGDLVPICEEAGLNVGASVMLGTASVLWESQEATASVKMMQEALSIPSFDEQDTAGPGKAGLLARLAHQLGEARLEKADVILANYLEPAIRQLNNRSDGPEAGEVFHEFAAFCDKQLQNPGNIEDFERIARLRQKKLAEVEELGRLMKSARQRDQRDTYASDQKKAKKWFDIDDAEYQRLKHTRETFMQQSLQNYMLTLRATNKYDIAVLRLFALWLENAQVQEANHIASKFLTGIPSWKFVQLMNQLMSRVEHDGSIFQKALSSLLLRICSDHPHHSLHHLFATTRKPVNSEAATVSRQRAAMTIRQQLASDPERSKLMQDVFDADRMYVQLANEESKTLPSLASIKDLPSTTQMRHQLPSLKLPPITLSIALRPNGDYSDVPVITRIGSTVRIMSGLSRPKAISVYASDGQQYQQLFKSGNDDLRQDAIMEQVFEEVSKMLRNHKATRQRDLVVRTYKVIPLNSNAGAIEFVPKSMSFSDFLRPAHQRYYPQDWKESRARDMINSVKENSTETRVKEFRKVCEHMHPVMRYFFFERFTDPDEWFQKRTAYTRTTATISILGYVLGLGDRHCQNIMLDEKSGEVVHIDLGVAFEAGRVLPIPELVPFRLSRDVVDGFGITKTEGVFRRCCEFTMDALRADKDSIMTLLNVLRYDPLYTWNVSPLRVKRIQEETGREEGGPSKRKEKEANEADRALSIVEKKLGKTLSTAATVNELIQQATDERNLATLFVGWAAWY